ncbi:bifunctional 4-hydroxy-2-oxoglutarate aldolase/2-dehydro-3-deoxy-phosphogluconate aldolase [Flammeovirga sp. MY04]|uniref:bifunctional 4-hydroxy-2-oxoglutarate aldolase/2-dehydro-3-deoxy-phosphogluconate aldolase n=1 Tax=Flammeovirga sp. MY04 TaxID=1191459 RepID=UPI0008062F7E|nr:bifunctional 4-hydroxy-2-oxoglutarate aldolase/2-dehydro-3-deoxy-phosphogluconate aldolase [Flammeovirga sp. MY04]ANQ52380.1 bifunctional 4-hydroxy-2-oxoglutarate aldolase/2-dehydro-3-deoxy-phosphogluconate aldolase [Flammeovirga sp. MY04]
MSTFSAQKFRELPVVGILRGIDKQTIDRIVPLYIGAGFTTLEITMNSEGATDLIAYVAEKYPEINVGAGTVCDLNDLEKALAAGSQFIVTPILDEEVIRKCKSLDVPVFPGSFSPTEIYKAWKAGATAVKIFPYTQFKVGYMKDVKAPLNEIELLPTGGVGVENIAEFFKGGAYGVGMGGSLFPKHLMAEDKADELKAHFEAIANAYYSTVPQEV